MRGSHDRGRALARSPATRKALGVKRGLERGYTERVPLPVSLSRTDRNLTCGTRFSRLPRSVIAVRSGCGAGELPCTHGRPPVFEKRTTFYVANALGYIVTG